jgi:invasion protein IalB
MTAPPNSSYKTSWARQHWIAGDTRLMMRIPVLVPALMCSLACGPTAARAQGANVGATFGTWSVFTSDSQNKLCFVASAPEDKKPAGANRAAVLFYISAWPKDGVRSEVSVKLGYQIKGGSAITVKVGKDSFKLFAKEERAFVADTTQELKLIEAMKKGQKVQVSATSERGTDTTDTYALSGLSQALQAMIAACP